jgi:two-component sensor histidine kinase
MSKPSDRHGNPAITFQYSVGEVERDLPEVYRAAGVMALFAASVVCLPAALADPGLTSRQRRASIVALAAAIVGSALGVRYPRHLGHVLRGHSQWTAICGGGFGILSNSAFGAWRSPTFFLGVMTTAVGAGATGARNGLRYGAGIALSALSGLALRTDAREASAARRAGWAYISTTVSFLDAGYLGGRIGDLSLRLRAFEEEASSEEERADQLRAIAEELDAVGQSYDGLLAQARRHREDDHALADMASRVRVLLIEANLGRTRPETIEQVLATTCQFWSGYARGHLSVSLEVQPTLAEQLSEDAAAGVIQVVNRALENIVKHARDARKATVRVFFDEHRVLRVHVQDDGGLVEIPRPDGGGTRQSRRWFEDHLAGHFERGYQHDGTHVHAWTEHGHRGRSLPQRRITSAWAQMDDDGRAVLACTRWATAIQALASLWIDTPRDPESVRTRLLVTAGIATIEAALVASRSAATAQASAIATLGLIAGFRDRRDYQALSGWATMVVCDYAWRAEHRPRRTLAGLLVAHFLGTRARPRTIRNWIQWSTNNAGVSLGVPSLVRTIRERGDRFVGNREERVGTAIARAETLDRVRAAVNVHHDFDAPLQELGLPAALEIEREALRDRYERARRLLGSMTAGEQPLVQIIGQTIAKRVAPARVTVDADPLPGVIHNSGCHDADVDDYIDRRAFTDLVRGIGDTLVRENSPTILGQWGLDSVLVSLRRHSDRVRLTVTPSPGPRRRDRGIQPLHLAASRLGGVFTGDLSGALSFEFPLRRLFTEEE